jgi:hypothetical protein
MVRKPLDKTAHSSLLTERYNSLQHKDIHLLRSPIPVLGQMYGISMFLSRRRSMELISSIGQPWSPRQLQRHPNHLLAEHNQTPRIRNPRLQNPRPALGTH